MAAVALRGGQREVSELPSFGWEIACWEKTLQGVKGRTVGAMHKAARSEERRVGKECRSRWSPYH